MPTAERRERKKERSRAAREAELKTLKRRKRLRTARNLALGFGIPILALVLFSLITNRDSTDESPAADTRELNADRPEGSPELVIDPDATYTAVLQTTEGDITFEMDPKVALWGVNNFVSLARDGFYDGLAFHRASKDFVIQGGDPEGTGGGGPGYQFTGELPDQPGYAVGQVAYANAGQSGAVGSQFFIVTGEKGSTLPANYALLGKVTAGLDVAQTIEGFAPGGGDGPPTTAVTITKVTIDGP